MSLVNECQFRAVSGGLGDFVVASAITGFFTPEQTTNPIIIDGGTYNWRAESDDFTQHELFRGTYDNATDTVARTTILQSSNGGAKVNFSAAPRVRQVAIQQDLSSKTTLSVDTDFYVATTGSDVIGNGSIGNPWATNFHAVIYIYNNYRIEDGSDARVIINTADGTYNEISPLPLLAIEGGPNNEHAFIGNLLNPGNVQIIVKNDTLNFFGVFDCKRSVWVVAGYALNADPTSTQYTSLLFVSDFGRLRYGALELGEVANSGGWFDVEGGFMTDTYGGTIEVTGTSALFFIQAYGKSIFNDGGLSTFHFQNNFSVGQAGVTAGIDAMVNTFHTFDLDGKTVTGKKYESYQFSSIIRSGAELPGSADGTIEPGSFYNGYGVAPSSTFANLLVDAVVGTQAVVTDSNTNTLGATIAGGGANQVLAWYSGTSNWTVIGL